jgi:nicotinate phosphoribosyltransferase
MEQIINSVLDTDLYKISMGNMVMMKFPNLKVRYRFIDRNNIIYPEGFDKELTKQIKIMENLCLTGQEKAFLKEKCDYLSPVYLDFLKGYRFDSNEVIAKQDREGKLTIDIEGYWYRTIYWEVPLMALVSELYFKMTGQTAKINEQKDIEKVKLFEKHNAYFADMGTRRRYSFDNHERIVKLFKEESNHTFVGTSNVYLGMKYDLPILGTYGHELVMVHGALYGYKMANSLTMKNWLDIYDEGKIGTVLPDTYTTDSFLKSFNYKYASLFRNIRHDSGDPFNFTDKVIENYKKLGIDPMTKSIIFSDGLNPKLACEIKEYCVGKIKSSFGLGTNFTNDVDVKPLNIVIKISEVLVNGEWYDAVKLSDTPGKNTGNEDEVDICKKVLKIK